MKTRCYLGLILLLSTPCYSQLFNIPEQYKGDCLVNKNNSIEENCPPNSIEIDFNDLYDIIHKNTVIYNDGDLKLVLNKKKYKYIDNQASYLQNIIVAEIELSLIYKQDIKDKIILASQFYSNEATWLGVQNYYISPNGNIYILLIKKQVYGKEYIFWKNYQIDKENLQFKLKKLLIDGSYQYQIIYPDQFKVLNQSSSSVFKTDKLKTCYQNEYSSTMCILDSYRYYHDILSQKLVSLAEKNLDTQESMEIIDKQINQICLTFPPPAYHYETTDFTHKITKCLVEQIKQKIDKLDEELDK